MTVEYIDFNQICISKYMIIDMIICFFITFKHLRLNIKNKNVFFFKIFMNTNIVTNVMSDVYIFLSLTYIYIIVILLYNRAVFTQ